MLTKKGQKECMQVGATIPTVAFVAFLSPPLTPYFIKRKHRSGRPMLEAAGVALVCSGATRAVVNDVLSALAGDSRFQLVTHAYPTAAVRDGAEPNAAVTPPLEIALLQRVDRSVRAEKGNAISLLLETESIPQYLWPAAHPFAHWIAQNAALFRGKRVLELGSGVGLAGFVASRFAALTVLTDCSAVSLAMLARTAALLPRGGVALAELKWGDDAAVETLLRHPMVAGDDSSPAEASRVPFDIVIGCDVFYFSSSLEAGLRTARAALRDDRGEAAGPKVFLCGTFVRSERMDADIAEVPPQMGFSTRVIDTTACEVPLPPPPPVGGATRGTERQQAEAQHLRILEWTLLQ